jgi:hypothetical protein
LFLLDFKGVLHRSVFSQDQYNAFFTDPATTPFIKYVAGVNKSASCTYSADQHLQTKKFVQICIAKKYIYIRKPNLCRILSATWQHWITGESEEICGNVVGVSVCT